MTGRRLTLLACLAFAITAHSRAQGHELGNETRINVHTAGNQGRPAVDVDADGDFVVVWQSYGQDGSYYGVFGRRFDSTGVPNGLVFQVNTYTPGWQSNAAVALDASGDFVVVWLSYPQDSGTSGVFARRFNAAGVAQAAEFRVNGFTAGHQGGAVLDLSASGDFVIAWQSPDQDGSGAGIFARRFNSVGTAQASELQVNSYVTGQQAYPAVGLDPEGDFVVAWSSLQDGNGFGVFAHRFSSSGAPQAGEIQINVVTTNHQLVPSVDLSASGDFVVTWTSELQDGSFDGIFARRFSASGTALGGELQVNAFTSSNQSQAVVSMEGDGDFVVTWWSNLQDGSATGIFARRFGADGAPESSELQVNTYTVGDQTSPAVAVDGQGAFIVAWQSANQDGDSNGVFARRVSTLTLDIDGDGSASPLTDGLLLLRALFGFTGTTLTSGALGAECTRCDADAVGTFVASGFARRSIGTPGPELQVNSYTVGNQTRGEVDMNRAGDFVVTWTSDGQDGSDDGLFAQRFDSAGAALGGEVQVNTFTLNDQRFPDVRIAENDAFVVAWESDGQVLGHDIFLRRFDSAGVGQAPGEVRVNTQTQDDQRHPRLAMTADGDFVVGWTDIGTAPQRLVAQRFNAAGVTQAGEFQLNAYTPAQSTALSSLAADDDGDFVVAWGTLYQDGSLAGVFGRRFSASGLPQGGDFQINTYTSDSQRGGRIAMNDDGKFVVVWESEGEQDGSESGIFGQRFDAQGQRQANEFQINVFTPGEQRNAVVGMDGAGGFVVAWQSRELDSSPVAVLARGFDSLGVPIGGEFQVNAYTLPLSINALLGPALDMDPSGDFVVVYVTNGQDGSGGGVFRRRFARANVSFDIDGDGTLNALTDGLLALRFLFGFTGSTLINGAVGPDCTRCTAPAIEAYLQTLI